MTQLLQAVSQGKFAEIEVMTQSAKPGLWSRDANDVTRYENVFVQPASEKATVAINMKSLADQLEAYFAPR